jgi:hypothetical protein
MGHVHHAPEAMSAEELAAHLEGLPEGEMVPLTALAQAYNTVRSVLVAASGISVLKLTGRLAGGDVAAVRAGLLGQLDLVREQLAVSETSRHPSVCRRVPLVRRAASLLREELERSHLRAEGEVELEPMFEALGLVRRARFVGAGMRELSSASCASWQDPHDHHHV